MATITPNLELALTLPHHNAWDAKPSEEQLDEWEKRSGTRFSDEALRTFVDEWKSNNTGVEFDDARSRYITNRQNHFVMHALQRRRDQRLRKCSFTEVINGTSVDISDVFDLLDQVAYKTRTVAVVYDSVFAYTLVTSEEEMSEDQIKGAFCEWVRENNPSEDIEPEHVEVRHYITFPAR